MSAMLPAEILLAAGRHYITNFDADSACRAAQRGFTIALAPLPSHMSRFLLSRLDALRFTKNAGHTYDRGFIFHVRQNIGKNRIKS